MASLETRYRYHGGPKYHDCCLMFATLGSSPRESRFIPPRTRCTCRAAAINSETGNLYPASEMAREAPLHRRRSGSPSHCRDAQQIAVAPNFPTGPVAIVGPSKRAPFDAGVIAPNQSIATRLRENGQPHINTGRSASAGRGNRHQGAAAAPQVDKRISARAERTCGYPAPAERPRARHRPRRPSITVTASSAASTGCASPRRDARICEPSQTSHT